MADYGVKGSVPGYDVKSVVDYLQSFNSSWPLLKVHETGNFSGTVTHGLGYPPFFLMASPTLTPGAVDEFAEEYGVDSNVLARTSGADTPRYFIFRLDITTDFTAPVVTGSTVKSTIDHDYGFKVAKPGKDVSSTDLRDFALHSGTRSPMVHKVNYGPTTNSGSALERTVNHGLTYTPTAFAFILPGTNTAGLSSTRHCIIPPPVGVAFGYYEVDSTKVYINLDPSFFSDTPQVSVVVLKDPFDKETVSVSYP